MPGSLSTQTTQPARRGSTLAWLICSLAAFFYCYEYLLRITPSVMMPDLMQAFNLSAFGVGLLAAAYSVAYTPLQVVVGLTLDAQGPRKVLTICLGLCGLGSILFGLAPSLAVAMLGRFLIGAGSAFAYVGVLKLASMWLPSHRFAFFVGLVNALGMLGAMGGDVGLAHLVGVLHWRGVMLLAGLLGLVLVPLFWWFIQERDTQADVAELATWNELFQQFQMVVKQPVLWASGILGSFYYLALGIFADLWGVPYLQAMFNTSKVHAGEINMMVYLGWLMASPFLGWLSDAWQTRKKILIVGGLGASTCFSLFLWRTDWSMTAASILLFGVGFFSTAEILVFAIASERVPRRMTATSLAFVNFLIMLAGMLLQPTIGKILDWHWVAHQGHQGHVYSLQAYQHALWCLPVLFVIGTVMACLIPETYQRTRSL